jgi:pilus assembly protein Flp/PilA
MLNSIRKFIRDEEGLTMVEYAIAGSLVGLACVLAFTNLGNAIADAIGDIITVLTTGAPPP